ncbi:uncharacterized protein EURHEDRAFT_101527 [Aspergillus ruber CBS 135680]|uniref:Mid2 domain-containing protein n=1 Tax=Aspergillus ruber (strain CBS 135680) TaxID=1388766 RepID=A0A017SB76_ASPRC|nr:uncharacterized protein EURHEDRAFT_101527 [Aspergillus ruber CBS 135680]EYE94298.1 hypothetical protein EURHEDRAFT_101527 [Aspergillus ruber CBS 135680]
MAANDTRPCYFPDRTEASDSTPCSSDQHTHCCGTGDVCLTNGYCLSIAHQPWVISRGACTNQNWDSGCPERCVGENDNRGGGCSIVNLEFENDDGKSTYCCGNPISGSSTTAECPTESQFTLEDAHAVPGYALLSNLSNFYVSGSAPSSSASPSILPAPTMSSSDSGDSDTCHDTAIGAGVGVPLGVIALASLAWAFFERKRVRAMHKQMSAMPAISTGMQQPPAYGINQKNQGPVELEQTTPVAELMERER